MFRYKSILKTYTDASKEEKSMVDDEDTKKLTQSKSIQSDPHQSEKQLEKTTSALLV